ncbi:dihydropyrimidinase [Pikeienuella piscinae]|uniref:Dihydropyrimidinase n=1 Tax=Pikeienuella piscinae TaxID=2748098 RepID=A0A7L5C2G5_9RHOB|nr:dihydropyrimidinase [Pikeienuella piscinae]QIE56736.1 dihydropyrimidinase [Pikeienuella piscinae]
MTEYDLVIRAGTVATAVDTFRADVGVSGGRIVALGENLAPGAREIDATGKLVLPGGIETHCHIEQESATGAMTADDYYSGSVSAAFGGNTSFVPFAAQHRGQSVRDVLETYDRRAAPKSVIDYSYHLIVSDPTETVLKEELPEAFERGITSFKVFLTYDKMVVDDRQFLDILATAKDHGALTMVHAENNGMIKWMVERLLAGGNDAPRYHATSHPAAAEVEAIGRGIQFASYIDAPLLFVHVSTPAGAGLIADAQMAGQRIYGETCPQYLFLTRQDLDRPGAEGAKFCCSPPLRDEATQVALWRYLRNGTLGLWSSDHAPYRFDESGKLSAGPNPAFNQVANGMPGIEMRLPLLFSEGVRKGRITLNDFVALSASNAARLFGMSDRKGSIAIGLDADIAIWDPTLEWRVSQAEMHDNMDYTPFDAMEMTGRPVTIISRGEVIVDGGELKAERGRGNFVKRAPFGIASLSHEMPAELDPARNFRAKIL